MLLTSYLIPMLTMTIHVCYTQLGGKKAKKSTSRKTDSSGSSSNNNNARNYGGLEEALQLPKISPMAANARRK